MSFFGKPKPKPQASPELRKSASPGKKAGTNKAPGIDRTVQKPTPLQLRRIQEQALKDLPNRKLYIVLYLRTPEPQKDDFHWGFYYHMDEDKGMKYQIVNAPGSTTRFMPDAGPTSGVMESMRLNVLIQIGSIPKDRAALLDKVMKHHNADVNAIPNVTCRVWEMTIIELLVKNKLIRCDDVGALQKECFEIGNKYADGCAKNNQPRPVVVSKVSS